MSNNSEIFFKIKVAKYIWDPCCQLLTETGSWLILINRPLHNRHLRIKTAILIIHRCLKFKFGMTKYLLLAGYSIIYISTPSHKYFSKLYHCYEVLKITYINETDYLTITMSVFFPVFIKSSDFKLDVSIQTFEGGGSQFN